MPKFLNAHFGHWCLDIGACLGQLEIRIIRNLQRFLTLHCYFTSFALNFTFIVMAPAVVLRWLGGFELLVDYIFPPGLNVFFPKHNLVGPSPLPSARHA